MLLSLGIFLPFHISSLLIINNINTVHQPHNICVYVQIYILTQTVSKCDGLERELDICGHKEMCGRGIGM